MPYFLRPLLLAMAMCLAIPASLHAQYWMQKGGGLTVDEGYDIAVDGSGNTYTTGYFTGTASFGSAASLVASGGTDIFVVKTNSQGVYQWAVKAGGSDADRGLSIQTDGSGNCYVCGYFSGTATFGSTSLTSAGLQDVFIAKYNGSGALQWVVQAGGSLSDIGAGISVDNSGNVVVTGEFRDSADFGSTTLVSSGGSADVFITKLNSSGAFQWTKQGAGVNTDRGIDVACDGSGNIYAIGQFSGTITFDVTHTNSMFNVVFVVKYSASGSEQWFRIIGGGSYNIANSIASDGSGNTYITGDFTGTLTFFGTPNTTLTNSYTNRIFIAKYTNSGTLSWASSAGSEGNLTSRSIAIDGSGNSYIAGHFTCRLDEYSEEYGEATFNSVGYSDIFVSKYNGSGEWQYSRNTGSKGDDYAFGAAVNSGGNIHFTGSFEGSLNFPVSANFIASNLSNWTQNSCTGNSPYCGDPDYGKFYKFNSAGNHDVVIANCFDPAREPYDYYERSGSACVRDIVSACINSGCPDTVTACSLASVVSFPHMCGDIGPALDYNWTGSSSNLPSTNYATSGTKVLTVTTDDGCFSTQDTIEVVIITVPKPSITDDLGININAINNVQTISICGPDTITLTGGNFANNTTILWTGQNLGSGVADTSISISWSGQFNFTVTDSTGCSNTNTIIVNIFPQQDSFDLEMNVDDTLQFCEEVGFSVWLYDSITNPTANQSCFTSLPYNVFTSWVITPAVTFTSQCQTQSSFFPSDTGYYTIEATVIRQTPCWIDTHYVTRTVYVEVLPAPVIPPFFIQITGSSYYCPGDSTMLVASGAPSYTWSGAGNNGNTNDTIWVSQTDWYIVSCTVTDTNSYGCTASYSTQSQKYVQQKPQPSVSAASYVICPNDSVLLQCTNTGGFTGYYWHGPNGPIPGNVAQIYVTEPGQYYCVFDDTDSCDLVSNTVLLTQYTTPEVMANGNTVICDGDSVTISVIATEGSTIEWQPPLTGNESQKTVYSPGVYSCKVTACGIETYATVEVFASYVQADITATEELCIDDTITLFGTPGMDTYLWWPGNQPTQNILVSNPGSFVLTTSDTNGCMAVSDTFVVSLDQVPTVIGIDTITTFCEGDSVVLTANDSMANYLWLPLSDTAQSVVIYNPGTVILTTLDTNGCTGTDSITLYTPSTYAPFQVVGDTNFCEGGAVVLNATGRGIAKFIWNPDGYEGKVFIVDTTGIYTLTTIDTFGCEANSRPVSVYMQPNLLTNPTGSDTVICAGTSVTLRATTDQGELYWYDDSGQKLLGTGTTFTTPVLKSNTLYYVWSSMSLCSSETLPIVVEVLNCDNIDIPNIFTPNGDGFNDVFRISLNKSKCFKCYIYNRWGSLIYESNNIDFSWDGTVTDTGEPATEGVYYYVVEYCKYNDVFATQRGHVTLIRNEDNRQ